MNEAFYQQKFAANQYPGEAYDIQSLLPKLELNDAYRYLEVGVGSGHFMAAFISAMKARPSRICAADLGNYLQPLPTFNTPVEFQAINLGKDTLPYANDSFDIVICNHVLEHIFETEFTLREFLRVIAPGGFCVISVPNIANWWSRFTFLLFGELPVGLETGTESADDGHTWFLRRRFKGSTPSGHIRGFTPRALRDLCERCGFQTVGWWNQNFEWRHKILQPKMGIVLRPHSKS